MNPLRSLTAVIVLSMVSIYAHASQFCGNTAFSVIPIVLIEEGGPQPPPSYNDGSYLVDWSDFISSDIVHDISPQATFIYTTAVMNFLEITSIYDLHSTFRENGDSLLETRLGLFFLQIKQSKLIESLWATSVRHTIGKSSDRNDYTGATSLNKVLQKNTQQEEQRKYLKNLARILVHMGKQLHQNLKLPTPISFQSILKLNFNYENQQVWQNLLAQLVRWQFASSTEMLKKVYCSSINANAKKLVIKIPPTPLLEFYIQEFAFWGEENSIPTTLEL